MQQRGGKRVNSSDDTTDRALIARAARAFYLDDRSKLQIAEELGVSRFKVARLLEAAKSSGIVSITINDDGISDERRAHRLREAMDISEAVVVGAAGDEESMRHTVGRAAASLLSATLSDCEVLGMGWGRTLSATAEAIQRLPSVSVVQLTGATEMTRHLSPVEIVRRIGLHSGGAMMPLFAPLVTDNAETAQMFRRQADIARAMAMFANVTTAVMSVGGWQPGLSQLYDTLDPLARDELTSRGVTAEMGVTLVDSAGNEVAPDFSERCVAVTSNELRAIPRVIAVAAGAAKADAVLALSRARLITEAVVDVSLADAVLKLAEDAK